MLMLLLLPLASAYIDPGTGGYIASGLGPAIWAMLLAAFGFIATLFRRVIIEKAKKNKAATVILIVIIAIILYLLFFQPEPKEIASGGVTGAAESPSTTASGPVKVTGSFQTVPSNLTFDPSVSGAHMYDASKAYDGYNLYNGMLMDMQGNVIKRWRSIYLGVLDSEGNYYAQQYYEAPKFGKYTFDDKVIWEKNIPIHHQIALMGNGNVLTFGKIVRMYNGRDVEFDTILEFDGDTGELVSNYSIYDHLAEFQQYHRELELDQPEGAEIPESHRMNQSIWGGHYDYYHANYINLIPQNTLSSEYEAFQKGNWILSFRHGSMVFILDKDTQDILWRAIYDQVEGTLEGQHSPQILDNGRVLVMDNGRYRESSRVIEIDPITLKVLWEYTNPDFYTLSQGNVQLLLNGNMLVAETEKGHVFEITRDGKTVWDFYSPDRIRDADPAYAGDLKKVGERQEIYKMYRYSKEFIEQFL